MTDSKTNAKKLALNCIIISNNALINDTALDDFRKQWPLESDFDKLLWCLMHEVEHYLVDADIRLKEPNYGQYQISIIRTLINDVVKKYKITQEDIRKASRRS